MNFTKVRYIMILMDYLSFQKKPTEGELTGFFLWLPIQRQNKGNTASCIYF